MFRNQMYFPLMKQLYHDYKYSSIFLGMTWTKEIRSIYERALKWTLPPSLNSFSFFCLNRKPHLLFSFCFQVSSLFENSLGTPLNKMEKKEKWNSQNPPILFLLFSSSPKSANLLHFFCQRLYKAKMEGSSITASCHTAWRSNVLAEGRRLGGDVWTGYSRNNRRAGLIQVGGEAWRQ